MSEAHHKQKRRKDEDVEYKPKAAADDAMPEAASLRREKPKAKDKPRKYFRDADLGKEGEDPRKREKRGVVEDDGEQPKPQRHKDHYGFKRGGDIASHDWNLEGKRDQDDAGLKHGRGRDFRDQADAYRRGNDRKDNYKEYQTDDRWKTDRYQEGSPYAREDRDAYKKTKRTKDTRNYREEVYDEYGKSYAGDNYYEDQGRYGNKKYYEEERTDRRRHDERQYNEKRGYDGYEERESKRRDYYYEETSHQPGDRPKHSGKQHHDDKFYGQQRHDDGHQQHRRQGDYYHDRPHRQRGEKDGYHKEAYAHGHKGYDYNDPQSHDATKQGSDQRHHGYGRDHPRGDYKHHGYAPVNDFFDPNHQPNTKADTQKPKDFAKGHLGNKDINAGPVKVMNVITDSAQKQTPQLLKDLEVPTQHRFPQSKFNKNSEKFVANASNLNFGMQGMTMPGMPATNQIPVAGKDNDTPPSTNNYSNNTFSQTIFINPHAAAQQMAPLSPFVDQAQASPSFGLAMPTLPQTPLPPVLAGQANALLAMSAPVYNPLLYPQYYMNAPYLAPYYVPTGDEQDDEDFDELTDEQAQFMAVFEMFKDSLLQESDEVEQAIQEHEFEQEQAAAEVFHAELQDCTCCRGYPLKCRGDICASLGTCHCALRKTKEEEEAHKDKFFVDEHKDCSCCRGFVYACSGAACKLSGRCKCDDD